MQQVFLIIIQQNCQAAIPATSGRRNCSCYSSDKCLRAESEEILVASKPHRGAAISPATVAAPFCFLFSAGIQVYQKDRGLLDPVPL
ncbi:Hypothetical predicted protein [Podarcis lilfordi]|uniref:Uncharacterized protein n=1 Tax=Podarcis lilfordi TaxID=74358 RepID=A0AA35P709_9SAUR|nr:Hypothetical predicted protein [Podarcis lilfordi]